MKINDRSNFSHLYYRNRNNWGSLLDLRVVTSDFAKEMNDAGGTIRWIVPDNLLKGNKPASEVKDIINEIRREITDHLPVLTRFGVKHK